MPRLTLRFPVIILCLISGLAFAQPTIVIQSSPADIIEQLHASLLSAMKINQSYQQRFQLLEHTIKDSFDVSTISRVSLGRTWKILEEDDKDQFIELLINTIISIYAKRFDSYNDQQFETLEAKEVNPDKWIVLLS